MRPISIGLCLAAILALIGCARHEYGGEISVAPRKPLEINIVSMDEAQAEPSLPFSAELPIDDLAKKRGTKVFAKYDLTLRRSPRDSAAETYRIRRGTPIYASRTANPDWMQVQLSRGRRAFVRSDQISPAEALALAQQRLDDKSRLSPRPRSENEADAGDGRGGTPAVRDGALLEAIERADEAFSSLEAGADRLRAEVGGFSGDSADWPEVRNSVSNQLTEFADDLQAFSATVNALASQSSGMTGNDRSALQAIEERESELRSLAQSLRGTLNQMVDGQDWTALVAEVQSKSDSIGAAVEAIRVQLARMS
jgi:methyl-accepting chemotaxis protein